MSKEVPVIPAHEPRRVRWANSRGLEVTLQSMSVMKLESIPLSMAGDPKWGPRPTPPTYIEEIEGGDPEVHVHTIVRDKEGNIIRSTFETPEDEAAWADYERRVLEWEGEAADRSLRIMLIDGVIIDDESLYAPDSDWAEVYEFQKGTPVPERKMARRYLFTREEVCASVDDIGHVMSTISELSGLPKEALASASAMFRSKV